MPKMTRRGFFAGLVALVASTALPKIATANPTKTEALDRIHTRRALMTIQQDIEKVMREFVFERNDAATRVAVRNNLISMLERYIPYDYSVVCDPTNNTDARIERGELWVDIVLKFDPTDRDYIYIPARLVGMKV